MNKYPVAPRLVFRADPEKGLPSVGKLYYGSPEHVEFMEFRRHNRKQYLLFTGLAVVLMTVSLTVTILAFLASRMSFTLAGFMLLIFLVGCWVAVYTKNVHDLGSEVTEKRLLSHAEHEMLRMWVEDRYGLKLTPVQVDDLLKGLIVWVDDRVGVVLTMGNGARFLSTIKASEYHS